MDPQNLTALTGLEHVRTFHDRVLFTTTAGTLAVSFWDEDMVRLRLGDAQVNQYPIISGEPADKPITYEQQDGIHLIRCGAGELRLDSGRRGQDASPEPFSVTFSHNGRQVVQPSPDGHFVRRFRIPPFARTEKGWFFSVALQAGAPIYGFGVNFGTLNKL